MIPLYAWICVLFGFGVAIALKEKQTSAASSYPLQTILLIMACMQLSALLYPLEKLRPSRLANQYAQQAMDKIAATPGDLYTLGNTADLTPIGKEPFANTVCMWDVQRGDHGAVRMEMDASLTEAVRQRRFVGIIASGPLPSDNPSFANYAGRVVLLLDAGQVAEIGKVLPITTIPTAIHLVGQ